MIIIRILLSVFVTFIGIILLRTLGFKPKAEETPDYGTEEFDRDKVITNLQTLVRCKTISYRDHSLEDEAEFQKLIDALPGLYPNVFATCTMQELGERSLLFHWKGKTDGDPAVLMAHYDVVPVEEDKWSKPAFAAILEDGVLWGRGTLDTKVTFNGILTAADHLIAQGFAPESDIYFAFSGGEEVNGLGAVRIVDYFEEKGITPAMVVDEGGAVVENVFPGVKEPCGLIGIAEKGMMDVEYRVESGGGHASAPLPHTPVGELATACVKVEGHPFPFQMTAPVEEMFDTLGRHSTFLYRMIFANLWCFKPVLNVICKKSGGEMNALMRTTVAFTQMQGSKASNVIPPTATLVSNLRLNPMDTMDSALSYLKTVVGNEKVQITALHGMDPSRISRTDCEGYERVKRAVAGTWKGSIVSPYLMVQCSDSRHYGRISDKVYRFSAMDLTKEDRGTIHGNDERIRVETAHRAAEFFIRLMRQC